MRYMKVYLEAIGYELPPLVVTTGELEERLAPLFAKLHIPEGQVEEWTGIRERRWWEAGYPLSQGAVEAARKAIRQSGISPRDIEILIYGGVCREQFEPATACRVASQLGISPDAEIFDISNACLGVLNGIVEVANRIELGHIRAGLVVSAESAREINEFAIERMLRKGTMEYFVGALATLTGGSGAVAVLVTDGSFTGTPGHRLVGSAACADPEFHSLCRWGMERAAGEHYIMTMCTDSVAVLKNGVELGKRTWKRFLRIMGWNAGDVDRTICHQVGSSHQEAILKALGIAPEKDFVTYPYLGNMGTVSLPLTAALADERGHLRKGHRTGFLGIGSGLNCLMLGWEW
ncbi:MAG: 3-oxoacyl-ACP synthase III [Candidatus Eremiobacteraeota bacterium]|nr:3-oxoacyl-ACP synthase III [Candidatus Eremiobacteraeota bacterium]